ERLQSEGDERAILAITNGVTANLWKAVSAEEKEEWRRKAREAALGTMSATQQEKYAPSASVSARASLTIHERNAVSMPTYMARCVSDGLKLYGAHFLILSVRQDSEDGWRQMQMDRPIEDSRELFLTAERISKGFHTSEFIQFWSNNPDGPSRPEKDEDENLLIDEDGHPRLRDLESPPNFSRLRKVVRVFLQAHWQMACGEKKKSPHYVGMTATRLNQYIDPEYLPGPDEAGNPFVLTKIGNMNKDVLTQWYHHLKNREARKNRGEIDWVFRFKKYSKTRK
ncbi:hypothetical protein K474DRAFT_1681038, partial [Panus rudis PR-1116 ss-1]